MCEIKFVYLVVSDRFGITVCSTSEIAESVKSDLLSLDSNICIQKQVLFTPDIFDKDIRVFKNSNDWSSHKFVLCQRVDCPDGLLFPYFSCALW